MGKLLDVREDGVPETYKVKRGEVTVGLVRRERKTGLSTPFALMVLGLILR